MPPTTSANVDATPAERAFTVDTSRAAAARTATGMAPDSADACPDRPRRPRTAAPPAPAAAGPTAGDDVLNGTAAGETICGLAGNDTINGLGGNDTLFGDACGKKAKRCSPPRRRRTATTS